MKVEENKRLNDGGAYVYSRGNQTAGAHIAGWCVVNPTWQSRRFPVTPAPGPLARLLSSDRLPALTLPARRSHSACSAFCLLPVHMSVSLWDSALAAPITVGLFSAVWVSSVCGQTWVVSSLDCNGLEGGRRGGGGGQGLPCPCPQQHEAPACPDCGRCPLMPLLVTSWES